MGCSSSKTTVSTPAPGTSDHVQKTSDQAQKKPDTVQKKSEISQKIPDIVQKKPETARKKPETAQKKPETAQKKPETARNKSETAQKKPETARKKPETTQKKPETAQKKPETARNKPETAQKKPETARKKPETTQKKPETTQKKPETAQKKPETTQKKPETTQKKPETAHKKPDNAENKISEEKFVSVQKTFNNDKLAALDYASVDTHARQAPSALRNSVQELVAYLTKPSKEPIIVVRAIFVWISENVAYDTDGLFGISKRASCGAESVMKGGKSVCEGYANVMATLCRDMCPLEHDGYYREAGIPVRKISGYAKGGDDSADTTFSTNMDTDHAWNAVHLNDKWYLIDSTWGAGHLGKNNTYEKCFKDFYFMTKPEEFVYSHFPYMDKDMEASMKWQLLEKPVTLEQFNKLVRLAPGAFMLGVRPVSHKEGCISMKNELTMSFQCVGQTELLYMTRLEYKQGNILYKQPRATFDQIENGLFKLRIHPHTTGTFELIAFGSKSSENETFHHLLTYAIQCEKVDDENFKFPETYLQAQVDRCLLMEPLQGQLRHNSAVTFHITSPVLNRVMINSTFLEKTGESFKGSVKTGSKGEKLTVFGSRNSDGSLGALYNFEVV